MLKRCIKLVVSMVVLLASAYASPAYAASADIMITHIQAGGPSAALQELVVLYNNAADDIDVTNWCLQNKSVVKFVCLTSSTVDERFIIPSRAYATIASSAYAVLNSSSSFAVTYLPTNQSSGSIVGGGDTISLINSVGTIVDTQSWSTSLTSGMMFVRLTNSEDTSLYKDTDSPNDWVMLSLGTPPSDGTARVIVVSEECSGEPCEVSVEPDLLPPYFTELLPNVTGSDAGKEFIELYNPNERLLSLNGYTIRYGAMLDKSIAFPEDMTIPARSYISFSNNIMNFSLPNTTSQLQLLMEDGTVVDEVSTYQDPKDDEAWALIDDAWQYTNRPTPGQENLVSVETLEDDAEVLKIPQPCAPNQYRNLETNRCRLIATSGSTITQCKDNQYRSEETNRCRNIVSATEPTPCKEGQERSPETNRCRTIKSMTTADYGVLGVQTNNDNKWYVWLAVGGILLLALAYSMWEWRYELGKVFWRMRQFVRIRK